MFRSVILISLLATTPVFAQCGADGPRLDRGGDVGWTTDVAAGFAEASVRGRPIVLYFTHDG